MYWESRKTSLTPIRKVANFLKQNKFFKKIFYILYSTRLADEAFIDSAIRHYKIKSVLDVPCGEGRAVFGSHPEIKWIAGVDIPGFPIEVARFRGYTELKTYHPPNYEFQISQQVDAITIMQVNAHIDIETFGKIMSQSLQNLKKGGIVILINEYNNDGLSYKFFQSSERKFQSFLKNTQHDYFEYETEFLEKLGDLFPKLQIIKRKPLSSDFVCLIDYYLYIFESTPYNFIYWLSMFLDIPLGILNYFENLFLKRVNKSFLVGYVCKIKD